MGSIKQSKGSFEDIRINIKIKLSALWASVTLCYLYGDYFELYVPQKTQGLVSGVNLLDSPLKLFLATILLAIPALMVCLSVILKPGVNRFCNMTFGIFYTAIMVLIAVTSVTPWRVFYVFLAIVESSITLLIFYTALRWPKTTR